MKDRIYQLMKQQGMSQKQFANELCVGEATLSSIFTGRTRPTTNIINNIHERFPEVSIPWIMFGEGHMYVGETVSEHLVTDPSAMNVAPPAADLFAEVPSQEPVSPSTSAHTTMPLMRETIKYVDKPQRKITEIRVFFDDGTYETFSA